MCTIDAATMERIKLTKKTFSLCLSFAAASPSLITTRVARLHTFKPKIPIWINFGEPWNGKCWYILIPFGIFYGH
jgi:hypothetical protein